MRSSSDILLIISSGGEVASPISFRVVAIWEHIIVFGRPFDILFLQGIHVHAWGRVEEVKFVAMMLVHIINHVVHVLIVLEGIHVSEIITEEDQDFISKIM